MAYLRGNPIWPGVLAGWRRQPYLLEAVLVGVISALVMIVVRSMVALRASQHELATTLYSIGDGVIATDAEGLVRRVNPVAEELTGWSEADAVGQPLEKVFVIVNEQTGRPVDNPVTQVLQQGTIFGLANHTLLISKAGRRIPIADTGAPIRDREGHITGVVLVFRDQTGERRVQQFTELRLSLIEYAAGHTLPDLLTYALDEIGSLVESPVGFYHFVEPDQRTLALQQWSSRTLDEFCQAEGEGMHYDIDQAGVWVECVHQKKPVVHNDYAALPHKKGAPPGHVEVIRELVVPVMRKDKVVAILGVGNKPTPYTQQDVERVAYLADVTWSIVQQKRAEAQVQADLAEKETLLREIHHRVKNNLQVISSLLDFQAQYTADAQAASALHESKRRVWAMALVHEQLYQPSELSRIDMGDYVRTLTADLAADRPHGPHGIEIVVEIEDVFFEVQRAIPCGMIVNELVSNALKHAFPPVADPVLPHQIRVTLHQDGPEQYCLTVCDNGVGLPADFRFPDEGSIGLFLVETFVRQLKGQIEWHDDAGTRCVIVF